MATMTACRSVINRRRIYILPTRFGFMLGFAILAAMLIAGLNYNSNLATGLCVSDGAAWPW